MRTFGKTGFNAGRFNLRVGNDIVSERLSGLLFVAVTAVIFANHENFFRFGAGCGSFCAFGIIVTDRGNFLRIGFAGTAFVLAFSVLASGFGAGRLLVNDIITEIVIVQFTDNNGICTSFICVFVNVLATIGVNRSASANIFNA